MPPLQVMVLPIGTVMAVGQLLEFSRVARVPNKRSIDIVPAPVHVRHGRISRDSRLKPSIVEVIRQGHFSLDLHQEHEPFIAAPIATQLLGREAGNPIPRMLVLSHLRLAGRQRQITPEWIRRANPVSCVILYVNSRIRPPCSARPLARQLSNKSCSQTSASGMPTALNTNSWPRPTLST